MDDKDLNLEIDYTGYEHSCKDLTILADGQLVECRRQKMHDDDHATAMGAGVIRWADK